ncbi:uncharacterized protein LOC116134922 [Pistacia vera]|uniref:uncharacterized protein LOC116134922 n=1 Tax=Pistacia vera TaxID=55513 RepID=UPI0012630EF5|nr:uncharacterized protein LOC116134922 [Pistacia vera]
MISKEIFNGIIYSTNAYQVWKDLQEQYHKVNGTRVYGIHQEIANLTQGASTIAIYYNKLKLLWDELNSLVSLPPPDSASARAYLDPLNQQKLLQFLIGLNDSYLMACCQILLMSPLPFVTQAYSVVNQDESQKVLSGISTNTEVTTTLYAQNSQRTQIKVPNIRDKGHVLSVNIVTCLGIKGRLVTNCMVTLLILKGRTM